jgi:molecular chaperone DnaJ
MTPSEARKILGVKSNTPVKDIKKRYKRLAMKHHPDRDGGNENKFKKIKEAKDTLILNNGVYTVSGNPKKIDPNFAIIMDEAEINKEITIRVPIISFCGGCENGMVQGSSVALCKVCKGKGMLSGENCQVCNGSGKIILNPCKRCNGTNYCNYYQKKKLIVRKSDYLNGYLDVGGIKSINRSSCKIKINGPEESVKRESRRSEDKILNIDVNLYTAIFGGSIKTKYNDQEIEIKIRSGTQCGDKISIDTEAGIVKGLIKVIIPTDLSLSEKKTIKAALYGSLNR